MEQYKHLQHLSFWRICCTATSFRFYLRSSYKWNWFLV